MTAASIDEYLSSIPEDKRAALTRIRVQIRAAAPAATEVISYGTPAYRLDQRYFVGFSATKRSCSFYAGRTPVQACADELATYRVWKGTINFKPVRPLPDELVAKLVQILLGEYQTA